MAISVQELRDILNDALEYLEDYDADQEIKTRCNTYGMRGHILEVSDGFVSLNDLEVEESDD